MYVVKVGEYYVRSVVCSEIMLSNEIMRGFDKETAEKLAKKLNCELVEITEEVTND